ncbi:MAG: DUF6502 family protein [Thiolinea sp.]
MQLNDWLAQHDRDTNPQVQGTGTVQAGVGIYYFEEVVDVTTAHTHKDSPHAV